MRKILSLLIAVVLGVSTAFATTVYCKMTHSWWCADGAAVAVHYWGGAAETTWPGVRMEAVTGEEGTWSYDVPADVTGLIFVRVNGSGEIADYGAKTVDLTLPTDGKNLFTITNETASWGDPGCNGVWSVYGEEPVTPTDFTKPFTLKFNGNGASDNSNSFTVESGVAAIFDEASAPYVSALNTVSNVYSARTIADDPSSLKFGTSTKKGTLAFTIGQAIEVDSIIVNATQYGNNAAEVTVNGTKFDLTQGNKVPTDCKLTPEGEVSTITIAQTGSERIYLRYVKVYPKQAGEEPPVEPTLANGFYLIGQNGWAVADLSADLLFAANPETEGEYKLTTTLAEGQSIKVVKVVNDAIVAWYPNGTGNEYTVDAAHAGENKDIYFRETYKEEWAAFGGHIWTGANEEPQVEKYCEKPSGHQKNPNFGDPSGRILLTIAKGEGNNIVVKIKNNNEAGNTHTGLNFLWVNAEGATGGVVRYGDGTHAEADVEEVSVIVPFEEARESYNFINIHWAYSGWEGEWAIDGLTVTAAELCEGAAPVEPTLANGFYLIGQNGWAVADLSADLLFAANPEAEGEHVLNTTLAAGQEIKVVKVENDAIVTWYPDGLGNAYTVDQNHAGATTIYFRPAGNAEWAAFGGYMYVVPTGTTGIDAIDANAPAVKVLRNGLILIKKGDKTYNVMGEIVR